MFVFALVLSLKLFCKFEFDNVKEILFLCLYEKILSLLNEFIISSIKSTFYKVMTLNKVWQHIYCSFEKRSNWKYVMSKSLKIFVKCHHWNVSSIHHFFLNWIKHAHVYSSLCETYTQIDLNRQCLVIVIIVLTSKQSFDQLKFWINDRNNVEEKYSWDAQLKKQTNSINDMREW